VEQIAGELRRDAEQPLALHGLVQVDDAQPVARGGGADQPAALERLPVAGQEVEARQVGDDRVRRQLREQAVELVGEARGIPRGHVVRPDRDRHDRVLDDRRVDVQQPRRLLLERGLQRRARDAEVDDAHRAAGAVLDAAREHSHI